MTKISIIIPVYNSAQYVEEAARSVLSQDCDSFELLLVDDGSTDASGDVCDRLAEEDSRVRVFHIENGGMCHARNFAMEHARGDYVAFCDNDDIYLPGLLSEAYRAAEESGAECVCYGIMIEQYNKEGAVSSKVIMCPQKAEVLVNEEIAQHFDSLYYASDGVWARIYKRSFLVENGIRFDENLRHGTEDILFNMDVIRVCRTIAFIPEVFYIWRRRASHSSSMVIAPDRIRGIEMLLKKENDFMLERGIDQLFPDLYAALLLSNFVDVATVAPLAGGQSFRVECKLYETLRKIYEPYRENILKAAPPLHTRLAFRALMAGRWRMLYCAMVSSSKIVSLVRRRSHVDGSVPASL